MSDVFMPRLSDTMTEGAIAQWLKAEGDPIARGDVLAEIETDKAVMDLEAYEAGVLEKILVAPGENVPIGQVIAVIGDGSGVAAAAAPPAATVPAGSAPAPASGEPAAAEPAPAPPASAQADGARVKATPLVRSLARAHGIDLSTVTGSGPAGRIVRADVEPLLGGASPASAQTSAPASVAAAPAAPAPATAATLDAADDERVPLSRIRAITAKRLTEAALVPVFQLTTVLDATKLGRLRAEINASVAPGGAKVSVTDLLVRACAVALRAHPEVNASFGGDAIVRHARVGVGVAVAIDDGLIVPVVRDADRKSVREIGAEIKDLAARARAGRLTPAELDGGTFTISNLGMYGIDSFTAVINPPQSTILAVGATVDEPVAIDGEVQIRPRARLTLTVDHRVLDGAVAAAFLRELTDLLTEPLRFLV